MLELICKGRPHLLEPLVFRLAMRQSWSVGAVTGWPAGETYRILRLARPAENAEENAPETPLAIIELQEIPGERTAVLITPTGPGDPGLEPFAKALVADLARFDFLARPDAPKEPLGFQLQPADDYDGKKLLEAFDAINSLEVRPAGPGRTRPATS